MSTRDRIVQYSDRIPVLNRANGRVCGHFIDYGFRQATDTGKKEWSNPAGRTDVARVGGIHRVDSLEHRTRNCSVKLAVRNGRVRCEIHTIRTSGPGNDRERVDGTISPPPMSGRGV